MPRPPGSSLRKQPARSGPSAWSCSRRLRGVNRPPDSPKCLTLAPACSLPRSCALSPPTCRSSWETVVCPKPSDKGVAPLGKYVIAPMRCGRLVCRRYSPDIRRAGIACKPLFSFPQLLTLRRTRNTFVGRLGSVPGFCAPYRLAPQRLLSATQRRYQVRRPQRRSPALSANYARVFIAAHTERKPPPDTQPTLDQIVLMVAGLGGLLNRRSDGFPGFQTLWIGLHRAADSVLAMEAQRGVGEGTYG